MFGTNMLFVCPLSSFVERHVCVLLLQLWDGCTYARGILFWCAVCLATLSTNARAMLVDEVDGKGRKLVHGSVF
jgi:hypothetical protein